MATDANSPLTGQFGSYDDLPRTLRREHEARAREAQMKGAPSGPSFGAPASAQAASSGLSAAAPASGGYADAAAYDTAALANGAPVPSVVKALDIPFGDLVSFFLKAVIAAVPALLLLMAVLWGVGQLLEVLAPDLLKMKILISFPNS